MDNNNVLERVKPEMVGISSNSIIDFLNLINDKQVNLHSFMLLRHGKIAAEGYYKPFDDKLRHKIFSVSKSITSAAVGLAIGDGILALEDHIVDFFPEKLKGEPHPFTAAMKVKHLLAMCTVHPRSTDTNVDDWVEVYLNTPPSRYPGTIFAYDSTGTNMLCAIIQKITGMTVHEYLRTRLFEPIGMGEVEWESCPLKINKGGGGIKCTSEDLARFGQLYLQKGVWSGKQIIPHGWVELSTRRHVDNTNSRFLLDGKTGYGYQFWRSRHDSYCGFGLGGQFVVVIPEKDAVFISTANTNLHKDGHQLILDCLWDAIYPALTDERQIAADPHSFAQMKQRLDGLTLILPKGHAHSILAQQVSGIRYRLEANQLDFDACEFVFNQEVCGLSLYKAGARNDIRFGINRWTIGEEPFTGNKSANAATWVDEKTCILQVQLFDYMKMFSMTCRFEQNRVVLHILPAGTSDAGSFECYLNGTSS